MSVVIRTQGLGKEYLIRHEQTTDESMLRESLTNIVGGLVGRRKRVTEERFWAVRDVNIEVHEGERFALIGGNGAGKSTLLKLLSRITEPTTGEFRIRGRVSSLLEVGTGFHPELTGRDNIFLSGAIRGMKHHEILKRFDEIIAFAETERFLDMPVKRYSSGMYARLAFSVAAHLESEIMIVDEVLSVGDAAFQNKCLSRMEELSKEGRTLLFVSHNMNSVKRLCKRGAYLVQGEVAGIGDIDEIMDLYMK